MASKKFSIFKKTSPALISETHDNQKFSPSKLLTTNISSMNNSNAIFNEYDITHPCEKASASSLPIDNTLSLVYDPFYEIDSSQLGSAAKILIMELADGQQSSPYQCATESTVPSLASTNNKTTTKTIFSKSVAQNSRRNNEILRSVKERNEMKTNEADDVNSIKQAKTFKRLTFSKRNNFLIPNKNNHKINEKKDVLQKTKNTATGPKRNRKLYFIPHENYSIRPKSTENISDDLVELKTRIRKSVNDKRNSRSPAKPLIFDEQNFIDSARADRNLRDMNAENQ